MRWAFQGVWDTCLCFGWGNCRRTDSKHAAWGMVGFCRTEGSVGLIGTRERQIMKGTEMIIAGL